MTHHVRKKRNRPFFDPFRGNLNLLISGHQRAGSLEFVLSGESFDPQSISHHPWRALLVLADFAQRHANASAYVSAAELALHLKSQEVLLTATPQDATKLVYRLRKQLNGLDVAQKLVSAGYLSKASEFGKSLIQRKKNLGYRLALLPFHLTIDLDEEPRG
jgi:hypothetical protein